VRGLQQPHHLPHILDDRVRHPLRRQLAGERAHRRRRRARLTFFTNRASAGFACPTVIPWITIHTTHHEDTKRNDRGVSTFVGSG
jgi:hypothetical protein